MSKDGIKSSILAFVSTRPGCTAIELVVGVGFGENFALDIPVLLEKLVDEGSLVEVEYTLPSMSYRTKSILFPKGSNLMITKDDNGINLICPTSANKVFPLGTTIRIIKQ